MKVEIDLNEMLGDEDGGFESLQESIRRQVIERVSSLTGKALKEKIDEAITNTIKAGIDKYLSEEMPKLAKELMDIEYTPVSEWGSRGQPTSVRKTLVEGITKQMEYKATSYSSDRNAFTRGVDDAVQSYIGQFKSKFDKKVDEMILKESLDHAVKKIKEKLGVKTA